MEENIFIKGNLHVTSEKYPSEPELKPTGVVFHVKEDVFFHHKDDDFIYPQSDTFIEDIFNKYDVKDIIAFSIKTEK